MNVRMVPCFECFGRGLVHADNGFMSSEEPCPVCHGEGEFLMTDRPEKPKLIDQIDPKRQDRL